jgi:hypothetical protein
MGTEGEIRGILADQRNELEIRHFPTRARELVTLPPEEGAEGHGGGDAGVMRAFADLVRANDWRNVPTSAAVSVQSHMMAAAAETSRLESRTIAMADFYTRMRSAVTSWSPAAHRQ